MLSTTTFPEIYNTTITSKYGIKYAQPTIRYNYVVGGIYPNDPTIAVVSVFNPNVEPKNIDGTIITIVQGVYGNNIGTVSAPAPVVQINDAVFKDRINIVFIDSPTPVNFNSLVLPNTITVIGNNAFYGCKYLTNVKFNIDTTMVRKSVSLYWSCFNNCYSLTSIQNSDIITYFEYGCFQNCTSLPTITLSSALKAIPINAFYNCTSLTSISIPSSVTSINENAFANCTSLTSISIPSSVIGIHATAFLNCTSLTLTFNYIGTIPVSILSGNSIRNVTLSNVTNIAATAFNNCTSLTSISIPSSVTSINATAFSNCTSLTLTFNYIGTIPVSILSGNSIRNVTLLNVTNIGATAFNNCTSLTSISIPSSVTGIHATAFSNCTGIKRFTSNTYLSNVSSVIFNMSLNSIDLSYNNSIDENTFKDKTGLTSIKLTSITSILANAFENCSGLSYVFLSGSVTAVDDNAFKNCSNITQLIFNSLSSLSIANMPIVLLNTGSKTKSALLLGNPIVANALIFQTIVNNIIFDNVTSIGDSAFALSGLESITIPESVTYIGQNAFFGCANLKNITLSSAIIPYNIFNGCNNVKSIIVNKYISNLAYVLYGVDNTNLDISFNYTGPIPDGVCYRKSKLKNITVPSSITSIGKCVFEGCTGLTNVTFQTTPQIKIFSNRLFYNCSSLQSITIPLSVTKIDDYVFTYCSSLTSITIPSNVTSIGQYAFSGCSGLTSVTFTSTTTMISIGIYAFQNCTSLTSITIPQTVTNINENIFEGCINLKSM